VIQATVVGDCLKVGSLCDAAISLDPYVSEAILAAYIIPLISAIHRAVSGGHSGTAVRRRAAQYSTKFPTTELPNHVNVCVPGVELLKPFGSVTLALYPTPPASPEVSAK